MNESIKEQIIKVCGKEYEYLAKKILLQEQEIQEELQNLVLSGHKDIAIEISRLRKQLKDEEEK